MAYRKPVAYSLPPPLAERIDRYAKKKNLTKSEIARAAFTRFLDDEEEREARWKRLRTVGAAAMKRAGIQSEEELQAVLYEMRHGRKVLDRGKNDLEKAIAAGQADIKAGRVSGPFATAKDTIRALNTTRRAPRER